MLFPGNELRVDTAGERKAVLEVEGVALTELTGIRPVGSSRLLPVFEVSRFLMIKPEYRTYKHYIAATPDTLCDGMR